MTIIRLQGEVEKRKGISFQFDIEAAPIGEGGMGKVYRGFCVDERNGSKRPVAIKLLYNDLPANAIERAKREASIQLRNDNLIEMLGFIETQEVSPTGAVIKHGHIVSELLSGVSLYDLLEGKTKDRDGEDVPFAVKMLQDYQNDSEHFAQKVVMNVLSGLMALHDAGYIHRDIDPSNIMLTSEGRIKLIDFGIAKQMNNLTTGDKALTVAGKFMGKPEYAAPELAMGDIQHQNQTTDIYAVGILLYQCILGHTPFEGARHEVLDMQLHNKIPVDKIKNKAIRNIIATACEKKQERRYQSSAQMRVALENLNGKTPVASARKKLILMASVITLVVVLAGIVTVVKIKQNQLREKTEMMLVERHQQEMLQKIQNRLADAEKLYDQGIKKEHDDYEKLLMSSFELFGEVETMAANNPSLDFDVENVAKKKVAIVTALEIVQKDFETQADMLEETEEVNLADSYRDRAEDVRKFILNNSEKNEQQE